MLIFILVCDHWIFYGADVVVFLCVVWRVFEQLLLVVL